MKLADAKAAVREAFRNLDDLAVTDVLRAVLRTENLRDYPFHRLEPERLARAISSTVALFNYNMKPQRKLKAVRK